MHACVGACLCMFGFGTSLCYGVSVQQQEFIVRLPKDLEAPEVEGSLGL